MIEHRRREEMNHPQNEQLAREEEEEEEEREEDEMKVCRGNVPSSSTFAAGATTTMTMTRRCNRGGRRSSGYASAAAVAFLCLSGPPPSSEAFVARTATLAEVSGRPAVAGLWNEEGRTVAAAAAGVGGGFSAIRLSHALRAKSSSDPDGVNNPSPSGNRSSNYYRGAVEDGRRDGESRFGVRRRIRSAVLRASVDVDEEGAPPASSSSESRLGVRRRVRSVLAKARSRTGIQNSSEEGGGVGGGGGVGAANGRKLNGSGTPLKTTLSGLDVVAEAASIGGLGAVVVDEESGAVDVALDYIPLVPSASEKKGGEAAAPAPADANANGSAATTRGDGTVTASASSTATAPSSSGGKAKKKSSPASTFSSPVVPPPAINPEDSFVPARPKAKKAGEGKAEASAPAAAAASAASGYTELDALKGDVSAAFSMPPPPLPFTLPELDAAQKAALAAGERVEFQADMGREGNGYVVLDVRAPQEVIWDTLLDFQSYPATIPTVRGVTMYTTVHKPDGRVTEMALPRSDARRPPGFDPDSKAYSDGTRAVLKHGVASVTRAAFTLSKFRLRIAAMHKYRPHPLGDYMVFTLDPTSKNMVLKNAKGVWHTQSNPDGMGEEYTRVWLLCELKVSPLLPQWITDYAAKRAMPRATTWLKPAVEVTADGQ
eukprot:CAMPEP_0113570700 /NCGR_PEP_ID=MMETSP0015_2-20120614/25127_1 /TAXON_ID=2838 /ORGANISM="Odontella" /LENGTH=658 /DNA_ID=CAMNT_0000473535 /DNA_START=148 /DNA_END=2127 /DNA_ORIENTATION=- /assembly_acc=CAM_ASM_000160